MRRLLRRKAEHLTLPGPTQKRTFTILDNRLAAEATWDFQLLAKEVDVEHPIVAPIVIIDAMLVYVARGIKARKKFIIGEPAGP